MKDSQIRTYILSKFIDGALKRVRIIRISSYQRVSEYSKKLFNLCNKGKNNKLLHNNKLLMDYTLKWVCVNH